MLRCCLLFFLLVGSFFAFSTRLAQAHPGLNEQAQVYQLSGAGATSTEPQHPNADPLPGGCVGVTPAGEAQPACCLNGYVYLDGQPISGAVVHIESRHGQQQLVTQRYPNTLQPEYRLALSAAPLSVNPGDTITVTAHYGDLTKSLRYVVQPGVQAVDVVLVPTDVGQSSNYIFDRQLWQQSDLGRLQRPHNIAMDSQGELYVLDTDNARVQVFDSQGNFLRGWGTQGNQIGEFFSPMGIAVDQSDHVYVADTANHRIQKFSRTGRPLMQFGSLGSADGQLRNPEGVAVAPNGNIYVADSQNNRIQQFDAGGRWLSTWGASGGGDGQFNYPTAITIDSQGALYVADYQNHRVQKFSSTGVWLTKWGSLDQCNAPTGCRAGGFYLPDGIALDADGNVLVSDANHRIQQFTRAGLFLSTLGSRGQNQGQFTYPKGLVTDDQNNLYVADEFNDRIQHFAANHTWRASWGDQGDNTRQLAQPAGAAVDTNGNLYVADSAHHRLQKFGPTGDWQSTFGSQGTADGQFTQPQDVALDDQGNLYVADSGNQRIQKFTSAGLFSRAWGSQGSGLAQFLTPSGVAVDSQGNVYVADTFNHRIQKFTREGVFVKAWGAQGAGNGQLNAPTELAVDSQGNVYVADTFNHRIQKFTSDGVFIKLWGGQGSRNGEFDTVTGIAVDNANQIFAADSTFRLQKFTTDGGWLATWGERGVRPGQLLAPLRVTTDAQDRVYVADTQNNRVQIFKPARYTKPIATITAVPQRTFNAGDTLVAYGLGQDSDQTPAIIAYRWTEVEAGDRVLGEAATLTIPAAHLTPGRPLIGLRVQDEEGEWSDLVTVRIVVAAPPQSVQRPWTMLLYLAGDYDDNGELANKFSDMLDQLCLQATQAGTTTVRIAALVDGPGDNDSFHIRIDPGAAQPCSPATLYEAVTEQAMDAPATLADFIAWGQSTFPAERYYLSIGNHGQAILGIAWDQTSDRADNGRLDYSAYLTVTELGTALHAPNTASVHVLHLDACSMNLVETAYELQERTAFLIASQYLGWDFFAYRAYAQAMTTAATPAQVAQAIVNGYADRAEAEQRPYTIAALDLNRAAPTLTAIDDLAGELIGLIDNGRLTRAELAHLWNATAKFESNGDLLNNALDLYIDLVHWTQLLQTQIADSAVRARAAALLDELSGEPRFIFVNRRQSNPLPPFYGGAQIDLAQANGVSIFYPGDHTNEEFQLYIEHQLFTFTRASRWPSFLAAALEPPSSAMPAPAPLAPLTGGVTLFLPLIVR